MKKNKCTTCENYDKENDTCKIKEITECSKNNFEKSKGCTEYLISEKLIMY